jgi:hypothetical protein
MAARYERPDPRLKRSAFLPADAVRLLLKRRGWTVALLAQHWDLHPDYLYRLIDNPARPPHWDAAFRGLTRCPVKARGPGRPSARELARRSRPAHSAPVSATPSLPRSPISPAKERSARIALDIAQTLARFGRLPPEHLSEPSPRLANILAVGQVVVALDDLGPVTADARGLVVNVSRDGPGLSEFYRVVFEGGVILRLSPQQALNALADTGETRDLAGIDCTDDLAIRRASLGGALRL